MNIILCKYFEISLLFTLVTSIPLFDKLLNDVKTSSDLPSKDHYFPDPLVQYSAHDMKWLRTSLLLINQCQKKSISLGNFLISFYHATRHK